MIDLSRQQHPRFHLHGLSGSVLMTQDPAHADAFDAKSLRSAASRFQANQASHRFNNTSFEYEQSVPGMAEAAHALVSNFDFDAVNALVSDPVQARRAAALGVISETLDPTSPARSFQPAANAGPRAA